MEELNELSEREHYFAEAKTSRVYNLLNSDSKQPLAMISPYRTSIKDEKGNTIYLTDEDNQKRMAELKNLVRNKYGLGYTEIKSIWVENNADSTEYSLLIGPIEYKLAFDLAQKFDQTSFIFKDENGKLFEVYTTISDDDFYKDYKIGDIIHIFKNSGQYLNINTAIDIFNRKSSGAVSKPKGRGVNRPFTFAELKEVWERHEPRPSYFQTEVREVRIL